MKRPAAFLFFTLLFGSYFVQLPLSGSLPGKVDSWFYVATFEYLIEGFKATIGGQPFGSSLYPEKSHLPFGNFSPAMGVVYACFRLLGTNVVWGFWGLTTFVFATNAFGASMVARAMGTKWVWAIVVGLFVTFNNFSLANLDNLDGLFWGPGLIAIALAVKAYHGVQLKLNWISLALGIQMMASGYMFLFSVLLVTPLIILRLWSERTNLRSTLLKVFSALAILSILLFPFVWFYFINGGITNTFNPAESSKSIWMHTGIRFADLFTYLPYNVLSTFFRTAGDNWYEKFHCAGIGFTLPVFGVLGIVRSGKKTHLTWWAAFFLILAIGPLFKMGEHIIPTPAYPIFKWLRLHSLIRLNLRAFLPVIACLSLGVVFLLGNWKTHRLIPSIIVLLILVENIPYKLRSYQSAQLLEHIDSSSSIITYQREAVILHLPTSFYSDVVPEFQQLRIEPKSSEEDVIREYAYMLFQATTGTNVVNGFTGFIPQSRIENQLKILSLADKDSCERLMEQNQIEHILIHLAWTNESNGWGSENYFREALSEYEIIYEDNDYILFNVAGPSHCFH